MLVDAEWKEAGDEYTRFKETDSKGNAGSWKALRLTAAENKPHNKSANHTAVDECCICLQGLQQKQVLGCKHSFCPNCIAPWLKKNPTCPLCRAPQSQQK